MDPIPGLPERSKLMETLEEMLTGREHPAVFAVSIDGYPALARSRPEAAEGAMREVARRLSGLVRSNDVLAVLAPGVFALAGSGVESADTEVVLERIRGVFAMPVEVADEAVSFPITVGIAHSSPEVTAEDLVDAAEADLRRQLEGD